MATAPLGIPVMNDRNEDPHQHAPLPGKLAAGDWINRSKALLAQDPAQAQVLIGNGLQLAPDLGAGYFNLGLALHQQARPAAAIRAYRLALVYGHRDSLVTRSAQRNLAQDLLLAGDFREGWSRYEDRLGDHDHRFFRERCGAPWQGIWDPRPLNRLVLVAEQGLGDTLMFCRLGLELQRALSVPVTLFCQKPLVPLLQRCSALDQVTFEVKEGLLNAPGSLWCPLMSLPSRWHLDPGTLKRRGPYLELAAATVERWRRKLKRRPGHRLIGLHWQGNPRHEGSLYSQGRSLPFAELCGLKDLEAVEFVSVQKGAGSEQLRLDAGLPFVMGQGEVGASMDFIDTAAVLANCDLLISADSGVVHLAGALGIPTWVALRFVPEWRWGLQGERTPWYPSLRLFRQPTHGDWPAVIGAMAECWRQEIQP